MVTKKRDPGICVWVTVGLGMCLCHVNAFPLRVEESNLDVMHSLSVQDPWEDRHIDLI